MQMPMPMPHGQPMRLPEQVAGSLSQIQGLLQASHPQIQQAYAMHWLAMRHAGFVPEFRQMTQDMLWGVYGTTALGGLLHYALSGRATPDVMAGIVDQLHLIQETYGRAAESLQKFLGRPEARDFEYVQPMVQSFRPLDQVYTSLHQPKEAVLTGFPWTPGPLLDLPGIRAAIPETPTESGTP